jgi:hypothetical protein
MAYLLADFQAPLTVLQRLRIIALRIISIPDIAKRVCNPTLAADLLALFSDSRDIDPQSVACGSADSA